MSETLAKALRPKSFRGIIGQGSVIRGLENQFASKRFPSAFMFSGAPGSGKTSLARIIALSVQCKHQEGGIGHPCKDCRRKKFDFNIYETNAAKFSGKDDIGDLAAGAEFSPLSPSLYRVYILDEAHQLTKHAQNLLLKPFEDAPRTTLWIICTTEPTKIIAALRRRCLHYSLKPLSYEAIDKLVNRSIEAIGSKVDGDAFIEEVNKAQLSSPGVILEALEKYIGGMSAKASVGQEGSGNVDSFRICKAVANGDIARLKTELKRSTQDDVRLIRASVSGYLNSIMMNSDKKELWCMVGIRNLAEITKLDDSIQMHYLNSLLMQMCYESPRRR